MQEVNSLVELRTENRIALRVRRQKCKEVLLKQRRLCLSDIDHFLKDKTRDQFKALCFEFKQNPTAEILKKIKNACMNLENIQAFYKVVGAFKSLVSVLIGNDSQKQLEAAACLTNLACGPHKCCFKVAEMAGAYLISYINGNSPFLQDQSAWAVGNIASDCIKCFNVLKAQGILPALLKALKSSIPSVVQSVIFALNACTKYEDPDIIAFVKPAFLKELLDLMLLENITQTALSDVAFTLVNCCYIAVVHNTEGAVYTDIAERVLKCLNEAMHDTQQYTALITPLIRCLGYLSSQDHISEFMCNDSTFQACAAKILHTECSFWIKEITWVLSNVSVLKGCNADNTELMLTAEHLKSFLKAQNSDTLQILYYLLVLVAQNKECYSLLKQLEVLQYVEYLSDCGEDNIENAAKLLLLQC